MAKHTKIAEHVRKAEELTQENGGTLPTTSSLKKSHPQLLLAMYRVPTAFSHVKRDRRPYSARIGPRTDAEWVAVAETVAETNGGFLPAHQDLMEQHPGLASCFYRKKELFAHIPRAKWTTNRGTRIGKYVAEAEKLAAENGGVLSLTREFLNKHGGLVGAIRNNPDAFKHIERAHRKTHTLAEHVATAERLAEEGGGMLASVGELKAKYPGLYTKMRKNPEAFAHVVQNKRTSVADYVTLAKELAEKNGGVLPGGSVLVEQGHRNLISMMYRNKAAFAGIQQERLNAGGQRISVKTL